MGVAVVKGILMDTLESGQMLPVLSPSWKVGAEGGRGFPALGPGCPRPQKPLFSLGVRDAMGRGQRSGWVRGKDTGAAQERDPSGPLGDQSEGVLKGRRSTKNGPAPRGYYF